MSVELDYKIGQLQYEISILGLDKEELTGVTKRTEELKDLVKNLSIHGVSNWVAIESDEQPERVTDVMVKYKDNRKEVAFFDGDGRFYTQNDDDITDKIASWYKLP